MSAFGFKAEPTSPLQLTTSARVQPRQTADGTGSKAVGLWSEMLRKLTLIAGLLGALMLPIGTVTGAYTRHSQSGYCQYQYEHCLIRCGVIVRKCIPGCERLLHHCKTPLPNIGELTGER